MDRVDVWLAGALLPGADSQKAATAFARAAGLRPEQALTLLNSGRPRLVKRGLSLEQGRAYVLQLRALGIGSGLRPSGAPVPAAVPEAQARTKPAPSGAATGMSRPAPPSRAGTAPAQPAKPPGRGRQAQPAAQAKVPVPEFDPEMPPRVAPTGIYAQQAEPAQQAGGDAPPVSIWRDSADQLPVELGRQWLEEARDIFSALPSVWVSAALAALYLPAAVLFLPLLMLLLVASEYPSLPPAISAAVTILLLPVFVGGITLMVQRHKAGEQILAGRVFAGFQQNAGQQMGVGLLALLYLGLLALGLFLLRSSWPEAFAHSGGRIGLGLGALFLALPLVSACFFAPALVALSGESAVGAMGKSLMASLRNWALFLNLGLLVVPIALGLALLVALGLYLGGALLAMFFFLPALPLVAIFFIMSYPATIDCFYDEEL